VSDDVSDSNDYLMTREISGSDACSISENISISKYYRMGNKNAGSNDYSMSKAKSVSVDLSTSKQISRGES
jgi:hypothetical protein